MFPLFYSLDHVTSMGRRVADAAMLLELMSDDGVRGEPPLARTGRSLAGMRIARATGYTADRVDPEVTATVDEAIRVLTDLGAEVEEVALPAWTWPPAS